MGSGPRFPRELMVPEIERILTAIGPDKAIVCGSYRRGCLTMGDIDLVSAGVHPDDLVSLGLRLKHPGNPRSEFEMDVSWCRRPIKVDLWMPAEGLLGACVLHATGSGLHNVLMRRWGLARGLRFDWLGVVEVLSGLRIAGETEDGCFEALGWPNNPPEMRDDVLGWALPLMESLERQGSSTDVRPDR